MRDCLTGESMSEKIKSLIDRLGTEHRLSKEEWVTVFSEWDDEDRAYAAEKARAVSLAQFGNKIFIRGIVEFSNICKNDCLYCGIRRSNTNAERYRLTEEEILSCCEEGYEYGFRTFVLQSGEDYGAYPPERMAGIVRSIKQAHPDCAVTLSLGELEYDALKLLKEAGADRYLLRHETADREHYGKLHPAEMSFDHRMQCLRWLKELGYQTGAGIMVGSPYQTNECLAEDMVFLAEFNPQMIGIGPFLPHKDTPFRDTFPALAVQDNAAPGTAARHHGSRHHPSRRQGAGSAGGGECYNAQSLAHGGEEEIYALRRKDLHRGPLGRMPRLHQG